MTTSNEAFYGVDFVRVEGNAGGCTFSCGPLRRAAAETLLTNLSVAAAHAGNAVHLEIKAASEAARRVVGDDWKPVVA